MESGNLNLLQLEGPENFNKWKFVLKTALEARGIWDIVEGKRKEPALVTDAQGRTNSEAINKWKMENAKAKSMIIGTLAPRMLCHVETCNNADEVFTSLKKVYSDASELNVQTTLQKFFSFKINENESAVEGALKIESLALSLKEMNEEVGNKMLIGRIVSALPSQRFGNFVEAWKSVAASEQTVENLLARIKNIELQQKLEGKFVSVEGECQAYFSNHNNNRGRDNRGGRQGKWQPKVQGGNQQKKRCFNCNSENHLAKDCDKNGNNDANNGRGDNNGAGRNGNGNQNRNHNRGGKGFRNKNRNKGRRAAHYNETEDDANRTDDCAYGAEVWLTIDDDEMIWQDVIPVNQAEEPEWESEPEKESKLKQEPERESEPEKESELKQEPERESERELVPEPELVSKQKVKPEHELVPKAESRAGTRAGAGA